MPRAQSPPGDGGDENAAATLSMTAKMLSVNPDPGYIWNHRREILVSSEIKKEAGMSDWVSEELRLTASCLEERNPKAYGAWFHRKWSVRRHVLGRAEDRGGDEAGGGESGVTSTQSSDLLRSELELCARFLTLDERNFHCWNYRRFVVSALAASLALEERGIALEGGTRQKHLADGSWEALNIRGEARMGPQLTTAITGDEEAERVISKPKELSDSVRDGLLHSEWEFTRAKVESNFSNGSAFHYRSKLLPLTLEMRLRSSSSFLPGEEENEVMVEYNTRMEMARDELELIRDAVYTEPDDQTAWWYHRFVVLWADPALTAAATAEDGRDAADNDDNKEDAVLSYMDLLEEEASSLRDLIEAEDGRCKWGLLALHMVLTALIGTLRLREGISISGEGWDEEEKIGWVEEANECLERLAKLDPDRGLRYESMRQRRRG